MTCTQTALFLAKQALTMYKVVAFLSTYCSNITYWTYAPYDAATPLRGFLQASNMTETPVGQASQVLRNAACKIA